MILSYTEFLLYVKWHHKVIYLYKQERTMDRIRIQVDSLGLLLEINVPTALIYVGMAVGLIIYISLIVVQLKKEQFWP